MTTEEAIKIIKNYDVNGCGYCHQGGDEVEEAFQMAISALENQKEDTADVKPIVYGKWVSAKEKLPKDGVDVLAYLESGEYVIRHIVEVFGYKEWSGGQIGERTHNVIAWQPLPAPYKESEE